MTTQATVLFVDDDRDFLESKQVYLEARGYRVLTAESPDAALALLETETPAIIFLDLMMEHVDDGFRLGYRIGKDERLGHIPLVMLSGVAAETGTRFDGEAGGLREWSRLARFLDKPVTGAQVLAVIEELAGAAARPASRPRSDARPGEETTMAEGSILIVDDEYGVRSGIRTILEMEGYEVGEAGDGAGALRALDERDYDVALLDYRLPDTDGLSLLQTMKQRGCDAMVCMITAYANIDTAIAATRQGVDFFLPKPFSPDDLEGVVATLLRHKQARTEAERLRAEHEASLLALAEEKTQTHSLVSSLRDAVLVVNRAGDVVLANPPMLELLGLGEDEVLMRPAQELLGGGALAPLCEQLAAPAKDRTVRQLELDEQTYMASIVTFRDEGGEERGRILTLSDISEVRRLAMEKQKFIRMMVHELKSPLGSIKGLLEVVTDKSLGEDLGPYLPMIARADHRIDNLVELIRDLLTLARSEQAPEGEEPELVPRRARAARGRGARPRTGRPARRDGDHRSRRGPAACPHPARRPPPRAQQPRRQRRQVQPRRRHGHGARRGGGRLAAAGRGRHRHRHQGGEPGAALGRVLPREA